MSNGGESKAVDPVMTGLPSGPTAIPVPNGSPGPAFEAVLQITAPVAPSYLVARKSQPGLQEEPPTTGLPSTPIPTLSAPPSETILQTTAPLAPFNLNSFEHPEPPQPSPATTASPSGPTTMPPGKKSDRGCVQRTAPVAPSYLITRKLPTTTGFPSLPMATT